MSSLKNLTAEFCPPKFGIPYEKSSKKMSRIVILTIKVSEGVVRFCGENCRLVIFSQIPPNDLLSTRITFTTFTQNIPVPIQAPPNILHPYSILAHKPPLLLECAVNNEGVPFRTTQAHPGC